MTKPSLSTPRGLGVVLHAAANTKVSAHEIRLSEERRGRCELTGVLDLGRRGARKRNAKRARPKRNCGRSIGTIRVRVARRKCEKLRERPRFRRAESQLDPSGLREREGRRLGEQVLLTLDVAERKARAAGGLGGSL